MHQEKAHMYFVIRDEIGRCFHNHKSLQRAEIVEFLGTDCVDAVAGLPLAMNVSAPFGRYVKSCQEYRDRMLRVVLPKGWQDAPDEYPENIGEYYLKKKWRNM